MEIKGSWRESRGLWERVSILAHCPFELRCLLACILLRSKAPAPWQLSQYR